MRVVADENIPYLKECFGQVAEVVALNGRTLTPSDVRNADALIVRSITPVGRHLLEGSSVRFVGSCTIGIDHVDTDYLDERGIQFASAPGSNADSAAQYTLNAILAMAERRLSNVSEQTVGIVGFGNVGSRLKALLDVLGIASKAYDPFLAERGRAGLSPLEEVLQADYISFHVPLTRSSKYPTWRMLNGDMLQAMNPDAAIINCARGDIIDPVALRADISQHNRRVALDVWPQEPMIDELLLSMVQIGTPHIAGYSFDGKLRGTEMVYQAFCEAMELDFYPPELDLKSPEPVHIPRGASPWEAVKLATRASYNIVSDDGDLRMLLNEKRANQGEYFDSLRKNYPVRREYSAFDCYVSNPAVSRWLSGLGFRVVSDAT